MFVREEKYDATGLIRPKSDKTMHEFDMQQGCFSLPILGCSDNISIPPWLTIGKFGIPISVDPPC